MLYIFLIISLLFFTAVAIKHFTRWPLCAICVSIATTWITLLILYRVNRFHDQVLLSLLMGQSTAGSYYQLQKRVPAALRIFTLPYFLTLTAAAYFLITAHLVFSAFILLTVLWVLTWFIFVYRNDPGKKSLAKATMDCCGGEQ